MPKLKSSSETSARDPDDNSSGFWTWDIKLLVVVNIVFLLVIGAGLVMVYKALNPSIQAYTQNLDLK